MKKILTLGIILIGVLCFTTESFAGPPHHWGPGPGPGWHGGYGPGWRGGWYPGPAAFWTNFGLNCGAMVATTAIALNNPPVVYATPSVVTIPAPTTVVVNQPPVYIQQPAPIITPTDYIESIVIAAPNGTQMTIQLRYSNGVWVGPKGEMYRDRPTPATLSAVYFR